MVRAGIGVAAAPCFLGDAAGLRRMGPPDPALGTELWILTHPSLRRVARVRAILDALTEALVRRRREFEGELLQPDTNLSP